MNFDKVPEGILRIEATMRSCDLGYLNRSDHVEVRFAGLATHDAFASVSGRVIAIVHSCSDAGNAEDSFVRMVVDLPAMGLTRARPSLSALRLSTTAPEIAVGPRIVLGKVMGLTDELASPPGREGRGDLRPN